MFSHEYLYKQDFYFFFRKKITSSNQLESPSQGCSQHTAVIWLGRMTDYFAELRLLCNLCCGAMLNWIEELCEIEHKS